MYLRDAMRVSALLVCAVLAGPAAAQDMTWTGGVGGFEETVGQQHQHRPLVQRQGLVQVLALRSLPQRQAAGLRSTSASMAATSSSTSTTKKPSTSWIRIIGAGLSLCRRTTRVRACGFGRSRSRSWTDPPGSGIWTRARWFMLFKRS